MRCLDRFNDKMKRGGGSLRGEHIRNSQNLLGETFADDASLTLGIYMWRLGLLEKESYKHENTIDIRLYKRTYSSANGVTVKFQTQINTPIIVGDILYNSNEDEYLICTESHNLDGIHYQGKLTLCNWILKWQDKKGEILKYPCYSINATQYNSGEQFNKQFVIGSAQHIILLPYDYNTVIIRSPQRFFLDRNPISPTSYIVTQNDTTSYNFGKKGIVKITVTEHPTNEATDRIDLGICDYVEITESVISNIDTMSVNVTDNLIYKSDISYDTTVIKSGGNSQIFIGNFFDNKDNEILDIIPKWEIVCDFIEALEIEQSGNKISIGIDNDDYVDEEFKLIFSDTENNYSSALLIQIESLL